jgi:phenylacetate-coenzyme A ligase PaaK-like adenylate-forming protein
LREYLTLEQLKKFTFKKIERLQNLRFRATCRFMLPYTKFYSELFKKYGIDPFSLNGVEDWHAKGLPLIKKATYMKNPEDFIVKPDLSKIFTDYFSYLDNQDEYGSALHLLFSKNKKEMLKEYYSPKMLIFSGGTESGNPTPVLLTGKQKFDTLMGILKIIGSVVLEHVSIDKKTGMNVFPYAPHLGWHAVHHALDINADLNLCTAAGGAVPTERLIALAGKAQPNIICGMSDYLRNRFLPMAIEKRITLPEQVLFINGAQKLVDAEREKITELARKVGVRQALVLDLYGASELKEALLPECSPGSGYHHIAPLSAIIKTVEVNHATEEVIDDWNFAPNGYAASWNIDGAGTVLGGYFIGDKYDSVIQEKCPHCELNVARIYGINRIREVEAQYRLTGVVEEKVKGTRVNLVAIRNTALSLPEVKEAQVHLNRKKGLIELRFISDAPAKAKKKLTGLFAGAEIRPKLVSSTLQKLQGDKIKFEGIKVE